MSGIFYPAGEIDNSLPSHELLLSEFERFNQLQRHYATRPYPEEGVFEESSVSSVVHRALRNLGNIAIINKFAIREGTRIAVPTSFDMEQIVPVVYKIDSSFQSPYRSKPVVVAARMTKQPEDERHPMALPGEDDFDDLVMAGIGVRVFHDRYEPRLGIGRAVTQVVGTREMVGYDVSLVSTKAGDIGRLIASKSLRLNPDSQFSVVKSDTVSNVPDESVRQFIQIFREAAWQSVSEPA